MKNNKKLLTGISLASALIVIASGAFAFFGDIAELEKQYAKVGSVELSGTIEIKHTQVKRNRLFNEYGGIYGEEDETGKGRYPYYPEGMATNSLNGTIKKLSYTDSSNKIYTNSIKKLSHAAPPRVTSREDVLNAFETAPNNLNPGDNLYDPNMNTNHGTDHELIVNVTNEGSKSIQTRIVFELTGTDAEGNALTADDLRYIHLYFDEMNSISGLTSIHNEGLVPKEIFSNRRELREMKEESQSENKLIYGFSTEETRYAIDRSQTKFGQFFLNELSDAVASNLVLSGNTIHDNREIESGIKYYYIEDEETEEWSLEAEKIEAPVSGSFKFDIAMASGFVYDDYSGDYELSVPDAINIQKLQNANIQIKVIIEGLQYRNTGEAMWEPLFGQTFDF